MDEDDLRKELVALELASSIVWMKDDSEPDEPACPTIIVHTNEEAADRVLAWLREHGYLPRGH